MLNLKAGIVSMVPMTSLKADPHQPRKTFDEKSLKELAESIKVRVEIPLKVRKAGAHWIIVDGERRYRAAKLAKIKALPCLLDEQTEAVELGATQLTTGVQREALGALDIGEFLVDLQKRGKYTMNQMAEALAKRGLHEIRRSKIASYMKLVELPDWAKAMTRAGELTEAHGSLILPTIKSSAWSKALKAIIRRALDWRGQVTVGEVQQGVEEALREVSIDLNAKFGEPMDVRAFPISICLRCEFYQATAKGQYCLNAQQFKVKQKEALAAKAEKEKDKDTAAAPSVFDDPEDVKPRKLKENAAGFVSLQGLKFDSYIALSQGRFDQTPCIPCPHRRAASPDGTPQTAGDYCFLPAHFAKLSKAGERLQSRKEHFRALLEIHLRNVLGAVGARRLSPGQKRGLLVWAATGAVERYSPHWDGGRSVQSAKIMQRFLGAKNLNTLSEIVGYTAKSGLSGDDEEALASLAMQAMSREQLRETGHLIGLDLSDPDHPYRVDAAYLRHKRKPELQDLMKRAYPERETVVGLSMWDLREALATPEAIAALGVPPDMIELYNEPFSVPADDEGAIEHAAEDNLVETIDDDEAAKLYEALN